MVYIRGSRHDFDDWAANGCTGWSYKDVLPYFIKSENVQIPELQNSGTYIPMPHNGYFERFNACCWEIHDNSGQANQCNGAIKNKSEFELDAWKPSNKKMKCILLRSLKCHLMFSLLRRNSFWFQITMVKKDRSTSTPAMPRPSWIYMAAPWRS